MKEAGELEKEAPYNQVVNNKYAEETIKNYQKQQIVVTKTCKNKLKMSKRWL